MVLAQPEKDKTLLAKKEEKTRQLEVLQTRLAQFSPASWVKKGEALVILTLVLLNFYLLAGFFGQKDGLNVYSAPLIPALSRLTFFLPEGIGLRFWLLIFYTALPVSLYFFAKEISGRKMAGFMSALAVSLPIGIFLPLRVNMGILGEDGPHLASLAIIPVSAFFLFRFLRTGDFWMAVVSGAFVTLVALASPLGLLTMICFASVITFSELLLGQARIKIMRLLVVIVLSSGLSAFWYNPQFFFLTLNSNQGRLIQSVFANLLPPSLFLVPILSVLGFLFFENRAHLQSVFIAIFLAIVFGLLSIPGSFVSGSRFLPVFGISLALLFGISTIWIFDFLRFSAWIGKKLDPLIAKYPKIQLSDPQESLAVGFMSLIFGSFVAVMLANGQLFWQIGEDQTIKDVLRQAQDKVIDKSIGLWEIRERTSNLEIFFGYFLTGLTIFGIFGLKNRLLKKKIT